MDQSDKFWEEQEKEIMEAIQRRLLSKTPHLSCGTPAIRAAMEKKKQSKPKDKKNE